MAQRAKVLAKQTNVEISCLLLQLKMINKQHKMIQFEDTPGHPSATVTIQRVNSVNSVNSVNIVNSYSAVLPPSPMVFFILGVLSPSGPYQALIILVLSSTTRTTCFPEYSEIGGGKKWN